MEKILMILSLLLALGIAQNVIPANWTSENAAQHGDNAVRLSVSVGENMVVVGPVLGLTSKARNGIPPTGLSGPALLTSNSNQANLQHGQIAMISCDPSGTWIGPIGVLSAAAESQVRAVVFYSQVAEWCNLTGYDDSYQWIYSMKSQSDTATMIKEVSTHDPDNDNGQVYAAIGFPAALRVINGTGADGSGGPGGDTHGNSRDQNQNPLGPSPSTAVAMIILYSITGLITALFLIIIVTGALRAHRHPERYGPRNIMGRPRQSRARGLARAMLDTLPIVKFGEREEPKPNDVELADSTNTNTENTDREATTGQETSPTQQTTAAANDATQQTQNRQSTEGGIAAAINDGQVSQTENPDNKGCSICTEDFEAGQDQRVLPCDHRFHPACIDPWLLNVSGTCPLCRIDLRPQSVEGGEGAEAANETDENGNPVLREGEFAPPLGPDETPNERQRMSVRRSIMLGIMGIGHPDRTTREERVLALRQLRGERLARQRREELAAVAETPEEETSTRRRLRNMLNVRTRRTGGEQASASGELGTPEGRDSPSASGT